jgi:hypothetical protein
MPSIGELARFLLAFAAGAMALLDGRAALACGTSGPDGVSACSLAEHDEAERPKWRLGLSGVYTSTSLHFSNDMHADETRAATLMSLSYAPTRVLSVEAGFGTAIGGTLTPPDGEHTFHSGPTAAIGASWHVVDGRAFVVLTSFLSFTSSRTRAKDAMATVAYDALDLRLGAIVGTTLWNVLSPYALGRVFGGPVYWTYQGASVTGTDTHHFQLGGGFALLITRRVDLFAEGVPFGERAVAGGLSVSF